MKQKGKTSKDVTESFIMMQNDMAWKYHRILSGDNFVLAVSHHVKTKITLTVGKKTNLGKERSRKLWNRLKQSKLSHFKIRL